jgi:hypothetical protein
MILIKIVIQISEPIFWEFFAHDFIIYDERKTNVLETVTEFSKQQTNVIFAIEKEQQNSINLLES